MISQEMLKALLTYEPETGVFRWKERPPEMFEDGCGRYNKERNCKRWNNQWADTEAGTTRPDGYKIITVKRRRYRSHHLAFLYVHGFLPGELDHIDNNPSNNRISNLREATRSQNMANSYNRRANRGVCWHRAAGKWEAHITINRKKHYLGLFRTQEEAAAARKAAAKEQFGEFSS